MRATLPSRFCRVPVSLTGLKGSFMAGRTRVCSALRASFCALLSALYVDVDPHERYECIPVARLWHELPHVSAHGESWKQRT